MVAPTVGQWAGSSENRSVRRKEPKMVVLLVVYWELRRVCCSAAQWEPWSVATRAVLRAATNVACWAYLKAGRLVVQSVAKLDKSKAESWVGWMAAESVVWLAV